MNTDLTDKYNRLTERTIGAFYKVYNKLGYGFLEKIYEKSLFIELRKFGLSVQSQAAIQVFYDNDLVGEYFADLLIENKLIVEIKAAKRLQL